MKGTQQVSQGRSSSDGPDVYATRAYTYVHDVPRSGDF